MVHLVQHPISHSGQPVPLEGQQLGIKAEDFIGRAQLDQTSGPVYLVQPPVSHSGQPVPLEGQQQGREAEAFP